ncbi:hypothetical protein [Solidesulfovibrio sp.]
MDAKDLLAAYARSKTQYGGTGLYLLSLWNIATSGGKHTFGIAIDDTIYSFPLDYSGLLAALATVLYGLVLYGRKTARGPLAATLLQPAGCPEPKTEAKAPEQGATP